MNATLKNKIDELQEGAEHDSAPLMLSQWERNFIKEVSKSSKNTSWKPTSNQSQKINELYEKFFKE